MAIKAGGECLWWRVRRFVGQPPTAMSEARGIVEGIELAREKGWQDIEVEGDSLAVIEELRKGRIDPYSVYSSIGERILALYHDFSSISFYFVKRSGNRVAHALPHFSSISVDMVENSVIPADLASII